MDDKELELVHQVIKFEHNYMKTEFKKILNGHGLSFEPKNDYEKGFKDCLMLINQAVNDM